MEAYISAPQEAEATRLQVQDQPGQLSETPSHDK